MPTLDPRVDAYIASAQSFAQPILRHVRKIVHKTCPEVSETMKWRFPHFEYHGILAGMAAFKAHCAILFWNPNLRKATDKGSFGNFGKVTRLEDLPEPAQLAKMIRETMAFNEAGRKRPSSKKALRKPKPKAPPDLISALAKNIKARATFESLSPTGQRDYIDWITEAKRDATRAQRLATTVEWLSEGKGRNWKYE